MPRRKNPRLMPMSEDDIIALTHKAIQLAKSGLESKVRQFQRSKDLEGHKNYPSKKEILERTVGMMPANIGRGPTSRFQGMSTIDVASGNQVSNTSNFILNFAPFTYSDIRGNEIDGMLAIAVNEESKSFVPPLKGLRWSMLNANTMNNEIKMYAYLVSSLFTSATARPKQRAKGSKEKQLQLNVVINPEYSFGDTIKLLSVEQGTLAYEMLFHSLKRIILHEFIHAMEVVPEETEDGQLIRVMNFLDNELQAERMMKEWKRYFPNKEFSAFGIYINEPLERRAYLSQILNEIVNYYTSGYGDNEVFDEAFFAARPEELALKSKWYRSHMSYMFPPTVDYFLSAIYQFQQEFYDYNLPRYYDLMDEIFEGQYLWKDRRKKYSQGESTKRKREKERHRRLGSQNDFVPSYLDDYLDDPPQQTTPSNFEKFLNLLRTNPKTR
jgi:hypothetical protein